MAKRVVAQRRTKTKTKKRVRFVVSACLIGKHCFFDGRAGCNQQVKELYAKGEAIALCPEELGGLKTPRPPAEIVGGTGNDVLAGRAFAFNKEGKDVSINYIRGSRAFLQLASDYGISQAILKARSPCCGKGMIYDGTFTHSLRNGSGVTASLLLKNGFEVFSDEEYSRMCVRAARTKPKKSPHAQKTKHTKKKHTTKKRTQR